jgi:hypothetical protein
VQWFISLTPALTSSMLMNRPAIGQKVTHLRIQFSPDLCFGFSCFHR